LSEPSLQDRVASQLATSHRALVEDAGAGRTQGSALQQRDHETALNDLELLYEALWQPSHGSSTFSASPEIRVS
jgi:hypothetical protein